MIVWIQMMEQGTTSRSMCVLGITQPATDNEDEEICVKRSSGPWSNIYGLLLRELTKATYLP